MKKSNTTSITIPLSKPIKRGDKDVSELILRKPNAGALRGCHIASLLQINFDELARVLPRITEPMLTQDEVMDMEAEDITAMGLQVSSFLATGSASTD